MPRKATRNAQGGGSIRKRSDGRWEARYTFGNDPGTGKQVQKSVYGKTQAEVRKKLQQATTSIDEGTYTEPTKMSVSKWLEIWEAEYLGGIKPSTAFLYSQQIRLYIKPSLGAVRLDTLDTHTIQKFYNSLGKDRDGKPPLSPKSIKNIHGIFHKALQQAVAIGYLRFNPSEACTLPRIIRKEIKPLDEQQITAFLQEIKGHRFETLFTVALFTGIREGEILGLMWDCVNLNNGTMRIDKQLKKEQKKGGTFYFAPPKNDKPRTITIAPWVIDLLRAHKEKQEENRLNAGDVWEENGLVFPNEIGQYLSYRTVYDSFKRAVNKIDCPSVRFHDLRHSYAVAAIRSGDDIKTVQENLGHATAAFTLDVYGHVTEQMKQDSAQRMQGFINSVLNL